MTSPPAETVTDAGFDLSDGVALVLAPLEEGAPRSGTREGPAHILRELFGEARARGVATGVYDLQRTRWSPLTVETLRRRLRTLDRDLGRRRPFFLGGCHALTFHTVAAMSAHSADLVLVVLDAHSDASPRQGLEVTHGCYLSHLKHLTGIEVIHLGGRYDPERLPQVADLFLTAQDIRTSAPGEVGRTLRARTRGRPVYLSVDVDALDPELMPAVHFPCPGGLRREHVAEIVSALSGDVVAADLVEFAPGDDRGGRADQEAAWLVSCIQSAFAPPAAATPEVRAPAAAALPAADVDTMLRRFYRRGLDDLAQAFDLAPRANAPPELPLARTVCAARRPDWLGEGRWDAATIVGGPCTYAMHRPEDLTFRELLEIAAVVAAAKVLDRPAVIYVDDAFGWTSPSKGGPAVVAAGQGDSVAAVRALKRFCRDLVGAVADSYGLDRHRVSVGWLSELRTHRLFRDRTAQMRQVLSAQADRNLFRLDRGAARRANPDWPLLVDGWAETLATYLPDVVELTAARPVGRVVAVESLDQTKAVRTAAVWWRDQAGDDAIGHLAHLPAPALSGQAMQRSPPGERFHPLQAYEDILAGLSRAPAEVRRFYADRLPSVEAACDAEPFGRLFELLSAVRRTRAATSAP